MRKFTYDPGNNTYETDDYSVRFIRSAIKLMFKNGPFLSLTILKKSSGNGCVIFLQVLAGTNTYTFHDDGLINEDIFNRCQENVDFLLNTTSDIYDIYLHRHNVAIDTEYDVISDEQLYDPENRFNKVMVTHRLYFITSDEKGIKNKYMNAHDKCFAKQMGMGEHSKSAYYTYGNIMCGSISKPLAKRAIN